MPTQQKRTFIQRLTFITRLIHKSNDKCSSHFVPMKSLSLVAEVLFFGLRKDAVLNRQHLNYPGKY